MANSKIGDWSGYGLKSIHDRDVLEIPLHGGRKFIPPLVPMVKAPIMHSRYNGFQRGVGKECYIENPSYLATFIGKVR